MLPYMMHKCHPSITWGRSSLNQFAFRLPYTFHLSFPASLLQKSAFIVPSSATCHTNVLETRCILRLSSSPGGIMVLSIQHVPTHQSTESCFDGVTDVPEWTRSAGPDLRYWRSGLLHFQLRCHRAFLQEPMPWRELHQPCGLAVQPASLQRRTGQPGCAFQQGMNLLVASKPQQSAACRHCQIYGEGYHCHPKLRICMSSRAVFPYMATSDSTKGQAM